MTTFFRTIFFILFLSACCVKLTAQTSRTNQPRLVVGIMVDGLQQNHIDALWNYLDPNGFKKIISKGANCQNLTYNIVSAGYASDIAAALTGTTPNYNGVIGDNYFNTKSHNIESILTDENQVGIGTSQKLSAHYLLSSTILDELMLAYPKKSKSYAIAIEPEAAIMMGGHTANSVAWIDDSNLKWVTTGYYADGLSRWADDMNVNGEFKTNATRSWEPLFNINTYLNRPAKEDKKAGFHYEPNSRSNKRSTSTIIKNTPAANRLVTDLGIKTLINAQLGLDVYPDMLMLEYTVRTPNEKTSTLQTAEKEDIYLRLDKDIQTLLLNIESKVGLDKTLVFVFTNQSDIHSPTELGENKIPAGYFNARRSTALLSTYLMAIYGQEKWINGYYGKNIYLNKQKIEEKKINLREMQQTIADFMLEFEGIRAAYPITKLLNENGGVDSEMGRIKNSSHKRSMGDVVISLLPGWIEVDDKNLAVGESNSIVSYSPAYFYGWKIQPQTIMKNYHITDIAPTLSKIVNIPVPNAATGKPIEEILK